MPGTTLPVEEVPAPITTPPPVSLLTTQERPEGFAVWLFDSTGAARKTLPMRSVTGATYSNDRRGGHNSFAVAVAIEDLRVWPVAVAGDRVEIWYKGRRRFRGYVTSPDALNGEPPRVGLTGYGLSNKIGRVMCDKRYSFRAGTDASEAFRALALDFIQPLFPGLVIEVETTGATISALDAGLKKFADVANELLRGLGEYASWGCDVVGDRDSDDPSNPDTGRDRLFLRASNTSVESLSYPVGSRSMKDLTSRADASDLCNSLTIFGGAARFPNLLPNSSFEFPTVSGEAEGNLLTNPSFTPRAVWVLESGASYKATGLSEGPSFEGPDMVLLDNASEGATQVVASVVVGHTYTFGIHVKRYAALVGVTVNVGVEWRNSGGSIISTNYISATPSNIFWERWEASAAAPVGATSVKFFARRSSGSSEAALIDAAFLYDASKVYQTGWTLDTRGNGTVVFYDLARPGGFDGGYCIRLQVTASGTDGSGQPSRVWLRPVNDQVIELLPGQAVRIGAATRAVAGLATGTVKLRLLCWTETGGHSELDYLSPALAIGADWAYQTFLTTNTTGKRIKGYLMVEFSDAGALDIDALSVRDGAGVGSTEPYLRDGPATWSFRAADICATDTPPQLSNARYGDWEDSEQVDSVTTYADALAFALLFFRDRAVPLIAPSLSISDPTRDQWPGLVALLTGLEGDALTGGVAFPISRVDGSINGSGLLTESVQLQRPRETTESMIRRIARQERGRSSGGGIGGGSYSPSGYSGSALGSSSSGTPSGPASGDLSGSYPAPTIGANKVGLSKILATGTAAAGKVLGYAAGGGGSLDWQVPEDWSLVYNAAAAQAGTKERVVVIDDASTTHYLAFDADVRVVTVRNGKASGNLSVFYQISSVDAWGDGYSGSYTLTPGQFARFAAIEDSGTLKGWRIG